MNAMCKHMTAYIEDGALQENSIELQQLLKPKRYVAYLMHKEPLP